MDKRSTGSMGWRVASIGLLRAAPLVDQALARFSENGGHALAFLILGRLLGVVPLQDFEFGAIGLVAAG